MFRLLALFIFITVGALAMATPMTISNKHYYFHSGTDERLKSLLKYGSLNESAFRMATSFGREVAYYGSGFYVGSTLTRLPLFGDLIVLEVPAEMDPGLLVKPEYGYYLYKQAVPGSRFITQEQFVDLLVAKRVSISSAEFAFMLGRMQIYGLNKILGKKSYLNNILSLIDQLSDFQGDRETFKMLIEKEVKRNFILNSGRMLVEQRSLVAQYDTAEELFGLASRFLDPKDLFKALSDLAEDPLVSNMYFHGRFPIVGDEFDIYESDKLTRLLDVFFSYDNLTGRDLIKKLFKERLLYAYGKEAGESWMRGAMLVDGLAHVRLPTYQDYLALHQVLYPAQVGGFHSFTLIKQSNKIQKKNYSLLPPRGLLRTGPIYLNSSDTKQSVGENSKLVSEERLLRLLANPYLKIDIKKQIGNEYKVLIQLPYTNQFEQQVR